jgi:TolB-like protein
LNQDTILDSQGPAAPEGLRPLVAVLSFTPAAGDEGLCLLGTEVADALREGLARDPALRAILINSDFLAKAPPHALELVCRELRVGHVLSGHCHGHGEHASLYIELADTREWHVRWARFYRGDARSLLAQDGEAIGRMLAELRPVLMPQRRR